MRSRILLRIQTLIPTPELIQIRLPKLLDSYSRLRFRPFNLFYSDSQSKTGKKYDSDSGFWNFSTPTPFRKWKTIPLLPTLNPTTTLETVGLRLQLQNWKKNDSDLWLQVLNIFDSNSKTKKKLSFLPTAIPTYIPTCFVSMSVLPFD